MAEEPETSPIAILGARPAGMACALGLMRVGHHVRIFERHPEARPAGNTLNLWPPPIRALEEMGVDVTDLGAPCHTTFRSVTGRVRADIRLPSDVVDRYHGGFIGMLRPDLYERMLAAIPRGVLRSDCTVTEIRDAGDMVHLRFADGTSATTPLLVGADGIHSTVRAHLLGDEAPREHRLHIVGGYTFGAPEGVERGECVIAHDRTEQASYSSIRSKGRDGFQWWVLEA